MMTAPLADLLGKAARGSRLRAPAAARLPGTRPRVESSAGHARHFELSTIRGEPHRSQTPSRRTHSPQLPSRLPSTHTPWSGRGSGRQGGAPCRTNDLDALGRDCSALPGSMADRMGARHTRPALANGAPAISEPERPCRRHALTGALRVQVSTHGPQFAAAPGADPGAEGAEGSGPRGQPALARALEPVKKVVTQSVVWGFVLSRLIVDTAASPDA